MSEFLDELARSLARPMPRSRALRLIGGAVVSAAVPALFPRRASARRLDGCNAKGGGCIPTARCCYASDGFAVSCCPTYFSCSPRSGLCAEQIACPDGRPFCGPAASKNCCNPNEVCFKGVCVVPCPPDQQICKGDCCPKGTECARFTFGGRKVETCTPKCPQGRSRCGPNCCPSRWRCANPDQGICKQCGPGQEQCGKKCCDRKASRCCGNAGCCPKNSSCCVSGGKAKCCPAGQKCALPIQPGDIGVNPGAAAVCCPQDRYVPAEELCCPPGKTALTGTTFRVGPGLEPYCCANDQVCRSGSSITCCQKSAVLGSETCCSGKCVDLRFDSQNCGSCGNVCPSGVCRAGVCASS